MTPLSKKLRGLDETAEILIPVDEVEEGAKPMNVGCLSRVVSFKNNVIDKAKMGLSELEQLLKRALREQTGCAFHFQATLSVFVFHLLFLSKLCTIGAHLC